MRIIKKIPRILLKVLRKIGFRLYRLVFYSLSIFTLTFIPWMLGWLIYIEVEMKKLRDKLSVEVIDIVAHNNQKLIDDKATEYQKIISENTNISNELVKKAKKEYFRHQIMRQKARYARAIALEYTIQYNNLKNVDLSTYFIVKHYKKEFSKI